MNSNILTDEHQNNFFSFKDHELINNILEYKIWNNTACCVSIEICFMHQNTRDILHCASSIQLAMLPMASAYL